MPMFNKNRILIGVNYYPVKEEDLQRIEIAKDSLRKLTGVERINIQYPDENYPEHGFKQINCLRFDSCLIARRKGAKKPIVRELLDITSAYAKENNIEYICFTNNDIIIIPELFETIKESPDSIAVSRYDIRSLEENHGYWFFYGFDTFLFKNSWYIENRRRFRNYIIGEALWDVAYTSISLCHGKCIVVNNGTPLAYHISHNVQWKNSPFAYHNEYLGSLDKIYIQMLSKYHKWREKSTQKEIDAHNLQVLHNYVHWPPSTASRVQHGIRVIRAILRYYVKKYAYKSSVI